MGQVPLSTTLLTWVAAGLADRRPVVVQADRGIGTSPELLRAIDRLAGPGGRLQAGGLDPVLGARSLAALGTPSRGCS